MRREIGMGGCEMLGGRGQAGKNEIGAYLHTRHGCVLRRRIHGHACSHPVSHAQLRQVYEQRRVAVQAEKAFLVTVL
eukprot:scaffold15973_cov137-Isochrysis_galbana.AAC.8